MTYEIKHKETKILLDKFVDSKPGEPIYFKFRTIHLAMEIDNLIDKIKKEIKVA